MNTGPGSCHAAAAPGSTQLIAANAKLALNSSGRRVPHKHNHSLRHSLTHSQNSLRLYETVQDTMKLAASWNTRTCCSVPSYTHHLHLTAASSLVTVSTNQHTKHCLAQAKLDHNACCPRYSSGEKPVSHSCQIHALAEALPHLQLRTSAAAQLMCYPRHAVRFVRPASSAQAMPSALPSSNR